MNIRLKLSRSQIRRLSRIERKTNDRLQALRIQILLLLHRKWLVKDIVDLLSCARATVYRTLYRFEDLGEASIEDQRKNREPIKANDKVRTRLFSYLEYTPRDFGWQRASWTLELFSLQLKDDENVTISPRHVKNILVSLHCRRGKPRVALRIPIRGRRKILRKIANIVRKANSTDEVFYVDEADVDLNPRIGYAYIPQGKQPLVLTPGKNVKRYLAAALNARTGKLVYTEGERKNSSLFVDLLKKMQATYRKAKRIILLLDNYVIHKSKMTRKALAEIGDRVRLVFFPPYSPESNKIERLWKQMHDHVTRNHQHRSIDDLMTAVRVFLKGVQPFPGSKVSIMKQVA
jgi:transposase